MQRKQANKGNPDNRLFLQQASTRNMIGGKTRVHQCRDRKEVPIAVHPDLRIHNKEKQQESGKSENQEQGKRVTIGFFPHQQNREDKKSHGRNQHLLIEKINQVLETEYRIFPVKKR